MNCVLCRRVTAGQAKAPGAAAAGADHVVDGARVFDRLEAALFDLNFVFATTARHRDMLKPVRGPGEAVAALRARHQRGEKTGILFGRERAGLSNEEMALADEIVTFPVNPALRLAEYRPGGAVDGI